MTEAKKANVTPEKIAALCIKAAEDKKAVNIVTLKVSEFSSLADYYVLCTGTSEPHLRAISDSIGREAKKQFHVSPRHVDGKPSSQWVLVDFGDVIAHVMTEEMRELYQLESLWGDAPKIESIEKLESICNQ